MQRPKKKFLKTQIIQIFSENRDTEHEMSLRQNYGKRDIINYNIPTLTLHELNLSFRAHMLKCTKSAIAGEEIFLL